MNNPLSKKEKFSNKLFDSLLDFENKLDSLTPQRPSFNNQERRQRNDQGISIHDLQLKDVAVKILDELRLLNCAIDAQTAADTVHRLKDTEFLNTPTKEDELMAIKTKATAVTKKIIGKKKEQAAKVVKQKTGKKEEVILTPKKRRVIMPASKAKLLPKLDTSTIKLIEKRLKILNFAEKGWWVCDDAHCFHCPWEPKSQPDPYYMRRKCLIECKKGWASPLQIKALAKKKGV